MIRLRRGLLLQLGHQEIDLIARVRIDGGLGG